VRRAGAAVAILLAIGVGGCDEQASPAAVQQQTAYQQNLLRHQEIVAQYMAKPLHKAFYLNPVTRNFSRSWGAPDVQTAIDQAEKRCKEAAAGVAPDRCVPIYVDEQEMLDWHNYDLSNQ
jgi:hypothetical protein